MKNRIRKGAIASLGVILLFSSVAHAHPNHWTSGTAGLHSSTYHSQNPGHLAIAIRAPGTGAISSGGRFHDSCSSQSCQGADSNWNADWALDIASQGGSDVYLNVAIDGWGTANATQTPNPNKEMTVWAVAGPTGNFRAAQGGDAACAWQRFDIKVSYTDTAGVVVNGNVGSIWLAHIVTMHAPNTLLSANAKVGTVYAGAGTVKNQYGNICSSGSHIHFEVLSTHNWGNAIEWHSSSGPDGYDNHIHSGKSVSPTGTPTYTIYGSGSNTYILSDSVTQNVTKLGWMGGDPTSFKMSDNPNTGDH